MPAISRVIAGRGLGVLVELGVVEQRYGAVLEVLDEGAAVTDVARRYGWRGRRCTSGWPDMPITAVWPPWQTGPRGR